MFVITLEYQGKEYKINDCFTNSDIVYYMWEQGNFSCDCNKSEFIHEIDNDFPVMDCGDEIKLISITDEIEEWDNEPEEENVF